MPASSEVVLPAGIDLHARPAATFVRTAMQFTSQVVIGAGDREADAKSLLSVLGLGAKAGTTVRLRADGDDAAEAVGILSACVAALE
jgi:phosphotransferase system HPr (HPr) family protein